MSIEIIPTCVPMSARELGEGAERIKAFASVIHIDVDDGILAPVITWPYKQDGMLGDFDLSNVHMESELHLMTKQPGEIGARVARAGSKRIIGHVEAFDNERETREALQSWKDAGAEAGLAILLPTPIEAIEPFLDMCDSVLMMSIATVGTQGIPYDESAPARIAEFHKRHPEMRIAVDGGVSEKNIVDLVRAGARRFSVGSAISKAPDPSVMYARLKALAESAIV